MDFLGKNILITGGSRGIGLTICNIFKSLGGNIISLNSKDCDFITFLDGGEIYPTQKCTKYVTYYQKNETMCYPLNLKGLPVYSLTSSNIFSSHFTIS